MEGPIVGGWVRELLDGIRASEGLELVLVTARELATTGAVSDPWGFTAVCVATLVGLLVTWVVFRLAMPFAIERAGS